MPEPREENRRRRAQDRAASWRCCGACSVRFKRLSPTLNGTSGASTRCDRVGWSCRPAYLSGLLPSTSFLAPAAALVWSTGPVGASRYPPWYVGSLGKYVPGKATVIVLRTALLRRDGVGHRRFDGHDFLRDADHDGRRRFCCRGDSAGDDARPMAIGAAFRPP